MLLSQFCFVLAATSQRAVLSPSAGIIFAGVRYFFTGHPIPFSMRRPALFYFVLERFADSW